MYNACMGANETLRDGEVLLHCVRRTYEGSSITLPDGRVLQIKKQVEDMIQNADVAMDILPSMFLVTSQMEEVCQSINSGLNNPEDYCRWKLTYAFNTQLSAEEEIALADAIRICVREMDYSGEGGF